MEKLFKRIREKKIIFSKEKCEFNKDSCVYYGMVFFKDGVFLDLKKVKVIKVVKFFCNVKELNFFLCIV